MVTVRAAAPPALAPPCRPRPPTAVEARLHRTPSPRVTGWASRSRAVSCRCRRRQPTGAP
eukprot:350440-Chlamydomonas_euryale.AAC.9